MQIIKRNRYWFGLAVLILPILLRGAWFYHGIPSLSKIQAPDYASNKIPVPPVSTTVAESVKAAPGKIVVVDAVHSNQFTPSELESFFSELSGRGARVEIDTGESSLSTRLKYASAYIIFSPNASYSAGEINLIQDFVAHGGRLLVFTDPTRGMTNIDMFSGTIISRPDSDFVNPLLAPFKITVSQDYLYDLVKNEGNFRNVFFAQFGKDPLTSDLTQVTLYGTHSLRADGSTPLLIGDQNTFSSSTDNGGNLAAAVISADGNVLAIGDLSFLTPPYNTVADNGLLIGRIADFALLGTRIHSVTDFPYVFDRPVTVLATGDLQLGTDLLGPIANLQNSLLATNISLKFNPKALANTDLLVLGSLDSSEDLAPYTEPFKLGLEDPMTVSLPDFGTVSRSGIGLLLYQHTEKRNTLVLLTDQGSDMPGLIDLLSSGDLSSCIIQQSVGICSLSSGGSSSSNYPSLYPDYSLYEYTPSVELPIDTTPTPGG